jgi:hypothetical protein
MGISAARNFNLLYIGLDIIWLCLFLTLLWVTKRRTALIVGLAAGLLYFIVDYGYFYFALNTRVVTGANTFWLLLWMSFTYGITNFAWIWILLDRDKNRLEWSLLIISAWGTIALLSQNFGANAATITTYRETDAYHGIMAAILFVGYFILIFHNLRCDPAEKIAIAPLLAIGIGVQFSWEAVLLLTGIRPSEWQPLIVNALIETNLGLPYTFMIHRAVRKRFG